MKLSELSRDLPKKKCKGDAEISSLCTDSRVAGNGDLFFCFRGNNTDAHAYAREAEERGAAAIVCEYDTGAKCPQLIVPDGREAMSRLSAAFYGNPEREMKIVGVTGTNGKTTVSHFLYRIFREAGINAGMIGTLGASYGDREIPPALTTPDPVSLFSLLADMKKAGSDTVVMEVSAHALALKKEIPITYEVAVFTNFTQDHLDFFGDMTAYGAAKRKLFDPTRCRFAVLNADDPFSQTVGTDKLAHVTYGIESPADCFAMIESETISGTEAMFNLNDELADVKIPLTGRHNVYNALAAACAARRLGISLGEIARGLSHTERVEGRLERVASYRGAEIFVDFAHTPDGLEKSLSALKCFCEGRLFVLFGCGGNRDAGKRPIMGETAAKHCDYAVLTSDNPRYEDPCEIIAQIERGFAGISKDYAVVEDREKATEYALGLLKKGDVLLVAGKGGETSQEIMGIKYNYNDKAVIRSLIGKLK